MIKGNSILVYHDAYLFYNRSTTLEVNTLGSTESGRSTKYACIRHTEITMQLLAMQFLA